jgi:hypothetical protein
MNTYILIGFDTKNDLILEQMDLVIFRKIYVLSNFYKSDMNNIEVINDMNSLDFYKNMDFENLDDNVIFIDCRENGCRNYLELMYFLGATRFDKRSYYINRSKTIRIADFLLTEHFDPWTGETIPKMINKDDKKAILSIYKSLTEVTRSYLKSGFREKKILNIPNGWMMNITTMELESLINYYKLISKIPDINRTIEFSHNSQYRQIVTQMLVSVVSNFVVKNKIVDPDSISDWFDYKNWNLSKMNFNL